MFFFFMPHLHVRKCRKQNTRVVDVYILKTCTTACIFIENNRTLIKGVICILAYYAPKYASINMSTWPYTYSYEYSTANTPKALSDSKKGKLVTLYN